MQQSLQWIKARRNDGAFVFCFYSPRSRLVPFFRLNGKSFCFSVQWLSVSYEQKRQDHLQFELFNNGGFV